MPSLHASDYSISRVICLCLLFVLSAPIPPAHAESRAFIDDLGRTVLLPAIPHRVISLAPSITEMLYALGLDREIVAVTQFCNYPPAALAKPTVGYSNPSLERLIAFTPDVIIAPREFIRADLLRELERHQIPTLILSAQSIRAIQAHLTLLGQVFHRPTEAKSIVTAINLRIDEISVRTKGLPPVRVLYVLHSQPLITVGPGSFLHELIELAGGQNVAAQATVPYPRLAMETVLRNDPEMLIFPIGKTDGIPPDERQVWQQWPFLSAVKTGRLRTVPSDLVNRPGPRVAEALGLLADLLHPVSDRASVQP
jgi:iron complex transport system substrate-binding protein